MLLWRFQNHEADKRSGYEARVLYLINPLAIDCDGILEAVALNERDQLHRKGKKSSSGKSKTH